MVLGDSDDPEIPVIVLNCINILESMNADSHGLMKRNLGSTLNKFESRIRRFNFMDPRVPPQPEHHVAVVFYLHAPEVIGLSVVPEYLLSTIGKAERGDLSLKKVLRRSLTPQQRLAVFRLWLIFVGVTDENNWSEIYRILYFDILGEPLRMLLTLMNLDYGNLRKFRKLLESDDYARKDKTIWILLNWVEKVKGIRLVFYKVALRSFVKKSYSNSLDNRKKKRQTSKASSLNSVRTLKMRNSFLGRVVNQINPTV